MKLAIVAGALIGALATHFLFTPHYGDCKKKDIGTVCILKGYSAK